jgi:hypothetical protein
MERESNRGSSAGAIESHVSFHKPIILNNKVRFSWTSAPLSKLFRDGKDYVELEYHQEVKLTYRIAYNQLCALFFPILHSAIQGKVYVQFEEIIPMESIQNWLEIRNCTSVSIVSQMSQSKVIQEVIEENKQPGIALLYGGGKDSLGALSIYSNMFPDEKINLLRIHWSRQSVTRHRSIFNQKVVTPLQEKIDINYLECSSTLHQNLINRKTAHHIGINFHHACCLPYYSQHHFRIVNYSYDSLEFFTKPSRGYLSLRPEKAKEMSRILHGLNIPTSIRNISFGIPSFSHFDIIKKDKRNLTAHTYMCEDTRERWCHNCRKCFCFALLCLESKIPSYESGIEYNRLFSMKGYFGNKVLDVLKLKNGDFSPVLAYSAQFSSFKHLLSNLEPKSLVQDEILTLEDGDKVEWLKNQYGQKFLITRQIWAKAVKLEDPLGHSQTIDYLRKIGIEIFDGENVRLRNEIISEYQFN